MTRTLARLAFVTALAAGGVVVLAGGAPGVDTVPGPQTATFDCTDGAQSWVVPAGVTQATFDVFGAAGGVGDDGQLDRPSAPAGLGGHTMATISVTPGETIQINVGCAGSDSLGASAPGGFGGSPGGNGGIGGDLGTGGGGGGSSDVRQGGAGLTDRVVVAGGGGGSGGASADQGGNGSGGAGGGETGIDGSGTDVGGGGKGTQSANGAGGDSTPCTSTGVDGENGTDGSGGAGGSLPTFGAGGGGGGGYHSGGGGAGCVNGAGGGGGAGFALSTATGVVQEVGVQSGDGRVVVTFTAAAPAVVIQPTFTG